LRVFGCTAYANVDNGKLEPRAVKCVILGYGSGVKAYKLWNPKTKRILMSKNVILNETVMFTDSQTSADSDASDVSDDEQHRGSMQVEHVEEKEDETTKNYDVDDTKQCATLLGLQVQSVVARVVFPTRISRG
jgi:hypothetical protein